MFFVALVVNPIIVYIYIRKNPYPLVFKTLRESGLPVFFTRSSAANIPVNMRICKELGFRMKIRTQFRSHWVLLLTWLAQLLRDLCFNPCSRSHSWHSSGFWNCTYS